jgi:hypothetical protein
MAGDFSRAWQQDVMEELFGGYSTNVAPSTYWFHLYATTLNDAATPATTGRCPGAAYDPVNKPNTTDTFSAPTAADPSLTQNKVEIVYTTNAGSDWGTVSSLLITTSSGTGGTAVGWADLSTDQTISSGNTVKFSTGALTISLT